MHQKIKDNGEVCMLNIKFGKDELIEFKIREIFEIAGYHRKRLNKFEDYTLYASNKDFIETSNVIAFSDANGRVLALKPDITLSIIKSIPNQPMEDFEQIYYVDEVYRFSRKSKEYKVKRQIGAEMIGKFSNETQNEIIKLSLKCLEAIGNNFLLDISHQSFIRSFMKACSMPVHIEKELLKYINTKNVHDMERLFADNSISEEYGNKIIKLCSINGNLSECIGMLEEFIISDECALAYKELLSIYECFKDSKYISNINLDFSVINHMDYYDGLIFLGYVEGKTSSVLSGGRYDKLLAKMSKDNNAIGFGINISDL